MFHKDQMSSKAYIFLLFLCFSLHTCNASRRNMNSLDKKMEKKLHFSLKIVEKNGFDSSQKNVKEGDNKMKINELVGDSEKSKNRISTNRKMLKGVGKVSVHGLQTKSHVSVSWRVPHKKKHSEKHPGFNLDYSPPKTHPPSHN